MREWGEKGREVDIEKGREIERESGRDNGRMRRERERGREIESRVTNNVLKHIKNLNWPELKRRSVNLTNKSFH